MSLLAPTTALFYRYMRIVVSGRLCCAHESLARSNYGLVNQLYSSFCLWTKLAWQLYARPDQPCVHTATRRCSGEPAATGSDVLQAKVVVMAQRQLRPRFSGTNMRVPLVGVPRFYSCFYLSRRIQWTNAFPTSLLSSTTRTADED